jgi:hypothetical protein
MKLLVLTSLALGTIAAAVTPQQPTEASHIIALTGSNGTDSPEIFLYSDADAAMPAAMPASPASASSDIVNTNPISIPRVNQRWYPTDPEPIIILPFHFQVIENCLSDNTLQARGVYLNRDYVRAYTLAENTAVAVDHGIGGYPYTFLIGPFDYASSSLYFSYDNGPWQCEWNDGETWRECGECRTGLWSAAPLDCGGASERTRVSDDASIGNSVWDVVLLTVCLCGSRLRRWTARSLWVGGVSSRVGLSELVG